MENVFRIQGFESEWEQLLPQPQQPYLSQAKFTYATLIFKYFRWTDQAPFVYIAKDVS